MTASAGRVEVDPSRTPALLTMMLFVWTVTVSLLTLIAGGGVLFDSFPRALLIGVSAVYAVVLTCLVPLGPIALVAALRARTGWARAACVATGGTAFVLTAPALAMAFGAAAFAYFGYVMGPGGLMPAWH